MDFLGEDLGNLRDLPSVAIDRIDIRIWDWSSFLTISW